MDKKKQFKAANEIKRLQKKKRPKYQSLNYSNKESNARAKRRNNFTSNRPSEDKLSLTATPDETKKLLQNMIATKYHRGAEPTHRRSRSNQWNRKNG